MELDYTSSVPLFDGADGINVTERSVKNAEWERKQRLREYRVAARREKRNRKADEKKQRKLNATILRRMTRNPDKYTKNAERNRVRAISAERSRIWSEAIRQAHRLAATHDPSGSKFNVAPVLRLDDGTVVTQEALRRRKEKEAARSTKEHKQISGHEDRGEDKVADVSPTGHESRSLSLVNGVNPSRLDLIDDMRSTSIPKGLSKSQQKKQAKYEPKPMPPKPIIPDGVVIPEGEENWLALWDLTDPQLERRVLREKRRKAAERKALRSKQQSGKAERRAARDEKRRVYRELKLTWKSIKEEETRHRTKLKGIEDEEAKRLAVEVNILERKQALEVCARFGFTLENTAGVDGIKPRALGMKGVEVDFNAIEIGEKPSEVKLRSNSRRVDLGKVSNFATEQVLPSGIRPEDDPEDYIRLDVGQGQDYEALNFNHKLRRKLRRAMENAQIQREVLVREQCRAYCKERGLEVPLEIETPAKPLHGTGSRTLENGVLENAKQERVRSRMDLAEYNKVAKVLRKQAKELAMEAGLRVHAELTGRLPPRGTPGNEAVVDYGTLWKNPPLP